MTDEPKRDIRIDLTEEEKRDIDDGKYDYDDLVNEHMIDVFVINSVHHNNIIYPDSYTYLHCRVDELHDILSSDYSEDFVCTIPISDFAKLQLWFIAKVHTTKILNNLAKSL